MIACDMVEKIKIFKKVLRDGFPVCIENITVKVYGISKALSGAELSPTFR